jgi:hypothetical protein
MFPLDSTWVVGSRLGTKSAAVAADAGTVADAGDQKQASNGAGAGGSVQRARCLAIASASPSSEA